MFHFWEADAPENEDHSSIVFAFLFFQALTACHPALRFLADDICSAKRQKVPHCFGLALIGREPFVGN
jgi:hypothetical protein